GIWNDLCRDAGFGRDAPASVKRGHEPKDGGNHGRLSDPLGLLRFVDCVATGGRLERYRGVGQFCQRRRVLLFRPQRKEPLMSKKSKKKKNKNTADPAVETNDQRGKAPA